MDSKVREHAALFRQLLQDQRETLKRRYESLMALGGDRLNHPLRERRLLEEMGSWIPLPHTCPAVVARLDAATFCSEERCGQKASLARAWSARHLGLKEEKTERLRAVAESPCWRDGFCRCRGRGKVVARVWALAGQQLKHTIADAQTKKSFLDGEACIQWLGVSHDEGAAPSEVVLWTHFR